MRPLEYISGKIDRDSYIERFWPEYKLIQYANTMLPEGTRILAVFLGNRGYYFDREVEFDIKFGESLICKDIQELSYPLDIALRLHERGVTHLFFREDLFNQFCLSKVSEPDKNKFLEFLNNHTTRLQRIPNHSLYALKDINE